MNGSPKVKKMINPFPPYISFTFNSKQVRQRALKGLDCSLHEFCLIS